jgi:hypothetical protein
LTVEAVELVPSVVDMFGWYYSDADRVLSDPDGRVVIADGRNHLELSDRQYDIIVTDPPPPIESSGASVISSFEYYRAGRNHLKQGGIMMQWVPWGSSVEEMRAHVRSFARVFPEVTLNFGPGGYGMFMMGSDQPVTIGDEDIRDLLARPGVLDDVSSAFDSPGHSVEDWIDVLTESAWIAGDTVDAWVGEGPLVTDDRPLPEYFLILRWLGPLSDRATEELLRSTVSTSVR